MKIFPSKEIKKLDSFTIEHEPISSIALMERAANAITNAITRIYPDRNIPFAIFAGSGNNGGDALAVTRMLSLNGYHCTAWLVSAGKTLSNDCRANFARLSAMKTVKTYTVTEDFIKPKLSAECVIIDGLFGSGLNRPAEGIFREVINFINRSGCRVVSIDIPSGMMGEENIDTPPTDIVHADDTITLQFPKLSFFFAENEPFVGNCEVLDIGISPEGIKTFETAYNLTEENDIDTIMQPRRRFAHKGNFGKGLLIAGSQGMAGASILAARAALLSGIGLLTIKTPSGNNNIVQTAVPEAMTIPDDCPTHITTPTNTEKYSAVAAGPGLGQKSETQNALKEIIKYSSVPMVADADALNILSQNPKYLEILPKGSILTPHTVEFDRLAGTSHSSYERLEKARTMAKRYNITIILKGAYTAVITPDGDCHFNTTGNPGMATGGSGDILTGILLALLAQGYAPTDAARLGVYVHGKAGDYAAIKTGETALTAGDIINNLPHAWLNIEKKMARHN